MYVLFGNIQTHMAIKLTAEDVKVITKVAFLIAIKIISYKFLRGTEYHFDMH